LTIVIRVLFWAATKKGCELAVRQRGKQPEDAMVNVMKEYDMEFVSK
jgi:hypothetical protein